MYYLRNRMLFKGIFSPQQHVNAGSRVDAATVTNTLEVTILAKAVLTQIVSTVTVIPILKPCVMSYRAS
jgi:hypothetical protein